MMGICTNRLTEVPKQPAGMNGVGRICPSDNLGDRLAGAMGPSMSFPSLHECSRHAGWYQLADPPIVTRPSADTDEFMRLPSNALKIVHVLA